MLTTLMGATILPPDPNVWEVLAGNIPTIGQSGIIVWVIYAILRGHLITGRQHKEAMANQEKQHQEQRSGWELEKAYLKESVKDERNGRINTQHEFAEYVRTVGIATNKVLGSLPTAAPETKPTGGDDATV